MKPLRLRLLVTLLALAVAATALVRLEQMRGEVGFENTTLADSPARIYRSDSPTDLLVVISHGFAGSRQMMEAISLTLARAGHTVVAFDYLGHGRLHAPLSPDVTRITGTTEDLVRQTLDVVAAARARTGLTDLAFVGHSMATDVVIRAADRLDDVQSVAAISMYSEAVTPQHPQRLLIVSGAQENRLREVALEAVRQLSPADEGQTEKQDEIERRAVVAPVVGHVGVLWSGTTATEIARWFGPEAHHANTGPWTAALLAALIALYWPLTRVLPEQAMTADVSPRRAAVAAGSASLAAALSAPWIGPALGFAGFGSLATFFSVWGMVALAVARPARKVRTADAAAALLLTAWSIGAFALALDRYGAAFLPVGPRLSLMALLLAPALLFAVADRALIAGRGLLMRVLLRLPTLAALLAAMVLVPDSMGLVFTVLPVLVLFLLVYGTLARWTAQRTGWLGSGLGAGVILAWSIAASTPLFGMA